MSPAEDDLRGIAQGLCNFSGKQLQAVAHLLTDAHIKEIKIGMDIPPTNQVRRADHSVQSLSVLAPALSQPHKHRLAAISGPLAVRGALRRQQH